MKKYIIYTDGSDLKHTSRRLGVGGILIDPSQGGDYGKKIGEFSKELSREEILRNYGTSDCSNPFAEMVAVYEAIKQFSSVLKPGDEITFKADYEGVRSWLTGKWKAKLPYIIQIRDEILSVLSKSGWKVSFEWVKGHQAKSVISPDAYWNGEVDKLAKGLC